jgi:hypothetical protein
MGQKQNVQVINLVTEKTLEESLLVTLEDKRDLALAALDTESTVDEVTMTRSQDSLKERLEILLGAKPDADVDVSMQDNAKHGVDSVAKRERVSAAGGEMLGAVFQFLGALVDTSTEKVAVSDDSVNSVRSQLESCMSPTTDGKQQLTFTLPSQEAVAKLAQTLATLMEVGKAAK